MSVPFGASWFCNLGVSTIWNLPQASTQPPTSFTTYQPRHTTRTSSVPSWSPWVDLLKLHLFQRSRVSKRIYPIVNLAVLIHPLWRHDFWDWYVPYQRRGKSHGAMSSRGVKCWMMEMLFFLGGGKRSLESDARGRDGSNPMGLGFWWQMMGMWGGYFSYSYEFFDVVTILCTCTVILRVDIWNCLGGPFWKCERFAAQWEYIFHP